MSVIRTLRSRAAVTAASFMFVLVLICSSVFLAEHTAHECTGEGCAVCMELSRCMNNIRTPGTSLPHIIIAAAITAVTVLYVNSTREAAGCATLISLKVELLN